MLVQIERARGKGANRQSEVRITLAGLSAIEIYAEGRAFTIY